MDRWLWHTLITMSHVHVPLCTIKHRCGSDVNIRLSHIVSPQINRMVNNTCSSSTYIINLTELELELHGRKY